MGRGVVEPATGRGGEALREAAYGGVVGEPHPGELQAGTAVEPHLLRPVDEYVGHAGHPQQRLQGSGADDVPVQRVVHGQDGGVPDGPALLAQRPGDQLGGQWRGVAGQALAHAVEQLDRTPPRSCGRRPSAGDQLVDDLARGAGEHAPA